MSASTIKEFLVSLGYKVDASSQRKFTDGVTGSTDLINKLGTALKVLAAGGVAYGAVRWMDRLAKGMEGMYYAAQRSGGGVRQLQAFTYAASQMGSTVEQALSSAQAMHQWMLNNPNGEALLRQNLHIRTRDASGKMLSGENILQNAGAAMRGLPSYRQNFISQQLGIPLELRQALMQQGQMQVWQAQYNGMLRKAGLDPDKAAANGRNFVQGARSLFAAFGIAGDAIGASLMGHSGAGGAIERFRDMVLSHIPQITTILSKFADAGVRAFGRMLDYLASVDWDAVFQKVGDFFTWLTGLKSSELLTGLKGIATVFAVLFGANMLSGVLALVPALASVSTFLVAAAGALGYIAGTKISDAIDGTPIGNAVGKTVTMAMAALGSKEAQQALYDNHLASLPAHERDTIIKARARAAKGGVVPSAVPLGIRNNNPGNLRTGPGGTFGEYATPQEGLDALGRQLSLYFSGKSAAAGHRKLQTLQDIISTYAPSSENDTGAYIADLAKKLNVKPDEALKLNDPTMLSGLMYGIVSHENGTTKNPYSSEMYLKAAHAAIDRAGGDAPTLNAETTIHVHGTADPTETAKAVSGQQIGVNQRAIRDLKLVNS